MIAAFDQAITLDCVEAALAQIRLGRPVVVLDDEQRENEGDLIFAAEFATPELVAFTVRHTSGFLCVALGETEANRLELPPMYPTNQDRHGTAYAVSVDARDGVSTGISARDRAQTIKLLASPHTQASDLSRPGHVIPLRAKRGGVLSRAGHTEAAIDLATLAGCNPVGVLCELVSQLSPTEMARAAELREFANRHQLAIISITDLIAYRRLHEPVMRRSAPTRLPLAQGTFSALGFARADDPREHLALVQGDISEAEDVIVRVHSECLVADVFGSLQCDCRAELDAALTSVAREGRGVVLYLRCRSGFGHNLMTGMASTVATDSGSHLSTISRTTGLPIDADDREISNYILSTLGINSVKLPMSAQPAARHSVPYSLASVVPHITGQRPRLVARNGLENVRSNVAVATTARAGSGTMDEPDSPLAVNRSG